MAPADREERMAKTLQIEHVFKVFGDQPERAMALADHIGPPDPDT